MGIDLSFLSDVISELNFFFTNLARSEQIKDVDMRSKTAKRAVDTDEDIASTSVNVFFKDNEVSMELHTNENNVSSVWKNNFRIMAKSILPTKLYELIEVYNGRLADQFAPALYSILGGAFT